MFPSWAKNLLFLIVAMLSGLVLVLIIEGLLSGTALLPFNSAVELAMIQLRTPLLTDFFVVVTSVGSPFIFSSIAFLVVAVFIIKRDIYEALLLITTMALSVISADILKELFQVARPTHELISTSGWSFPSGHATIATTFFFTLGYIFFNKVKTIAGKLNLILGAILGVALVSLSRLYLGAHWALDVLGGMALGALSVSLTVIIFSIFFEHRRSDRKKLGL